MSDEQLDDRRVIHAITRRLERHLTELGRLEALRDEEHARVNEWFDDVSHGERREIERLTAEAQAWALAHRDERTMSWSTPWAKITTRPKPGTTAIDDEAAFIAWCEENGYARTTVKPDVKAIRKDFAVVDGAIVYPCGEDQYRPIPGVHVEGFGEIGVTIKPFSPGVDAVDEEA